jgi:hypothetical protein
VARAHVVDHAPGRLRAHAGEELDGAETGDAVARVLGPAQQRQHVLDVGGLEELEPAVLHERDIAPRQLQLQARAVRRGAKQHRLLLEPQPFLAARQHAVDDEAACAASSFTVTRRGRAPSRARSTGSS